jgi:hypothetical protein
MDWSGLIQLFMFDILTILIIWFCRRLITLQETRWYLLHKLLNGPCFRTWFDKGLRDTKPTTTAIFPFNESAKTLTPVG